MWARGLCLRCYKRNRTGTDTAALSRYGQPDGYGHYGVLTEDGDSVLCHECGRWLRGLGAHVHAVHDMTATDYRIAHGLPRGRGLVATEISRQLSARSRAQVGSQGWQRFAAARDPIRAAQAREEPGRLTAPAALRVRGATAARNGAASRSAEIRSCPVCGAQWCPLPGGYRIRTCGAAACRRARRAESTRKRRAAAPTLTEQQREAVASLRGEALQQEVRRLKQTGISQRDMATAVGTSNRAMSRLINGHIPASLR